MPFIFFIAYILIEIGLFVIIGGALGVGMTLLWVLAGFVIGGLMLSRGGSVGREWLQNARAGNMESTPASRPIFWFIGGLLVILPGFFTDILGLALIFPPTQMLITAFFSMLVPASVQSGFSFFSSMSEFRNENENTISGEAVEILDEEITDQRDKDQNA